LLQIRGKPFAVEDRSLACSFSRSMLVQAQTHTDSVQCQDVPSVAGLYRVSLTYDGLNFLEVQGELEVLEPASVVVERVVPRFLIQQEAQARLASLSMQIYGAGLDSISEESVSVIFDEERGPVPLQAFEAVESGLLRFELPRRPRVSLRVLISVAGRIVELSVQTVERPVVPPQKLTVYEGQPVIIQASGLFDQLAIFCLVGAH
jgi:hypothetical protein